MKRLAGKCLLFFALCLGCSARVQAVGSSASAPAELSFGDVPVGASKSLKLAVTNESQEELSLEVDVAPPFSVTAPVPSTVAPGGSASLEVVFTPAAGQAYAQTLTLRLSATDTPSLPVQLTGNGLPPAACSAANCNGASACCGGQCVDTSSDPAHCGGCSACAGGQSCVSGVCTSGAATGCSAATCSGAGQACCGDACVDTSSDAAHCGGCSPCAAGQSCVGGTCVTPSTGGACDDLTNPCPGGQKCCDHACTAVGPNNICPCSGPGGLTTFDTGTIIIPMDACYQRGTDVATLPAHCYVNNSVQTGSDAPLKAYGLVFFLLRHQVTVYMGLNPNKTSIDDVDLSIGSFLTHITPVQRYDWASGAVVSFPDTTQNTVSYRGAPFIIDATQHDRVLALLRSDPDFAQFRSAGNVNVHVAGKPFQTAIAKSISTTPSRIALLYASTGSQVTTDILVRYLDSAGLNFAGAGGTPAAPGQIYDVLQEGDFLPDYDHSALKAGGYTMLWSPHWEGGTANTPAQLASIGAFVNAGNDLFAECAAIGTLEGFNGGSRFNQPGSAATRFMTSTGMIGNSISTGGGGYTGPFTSGGLTSAFAQRGDFTFVGFGGLITDFEPGAGSMYLQDVVRYITAGPGTDLFTSIDQHASGKGTVVYLSGHDYSYGGNSSGQLGVTAGSRLVLNTLFSLGQNNICQ